MKHGLTNQNWAPQRRTHHHRNSISNRLRNRLAHETLEPRQLLAGDPIIAEFQAINDTTLQDEDGDYSDWIEIRNLRAESINLEGWYLTDDDTDLRKWQFPAISISANDELVVFASNKDRVASGGELHTNFRLSGNGEYLALVKPDGITIADAFAPEYPPQIADQSYGRAVGRDTTRLVEQGSIVATHVPLDDALGNDWTAVDFDDSGWRHGTTGVGFEQLKESQQINESFDTDLGPEWTVDIPAEGASNVTVEDGQLLVSTPGGQTSGNDQRRGLAPFIHRQLPDDAINFEVVTRIHTPTAGSAGIVVYDAASERPVLVFEYQRRSTFRLTNPEGRRVDSVRANGEDSSFLRLRRDGSAGVWSAYFKLLEEDDWTLVATINDSDPTMMPITDARFGLHTNTSSTAIDARFDFVDVEIDAQLPTYDDRIGLNVEQDAFGVNSSVYMRMPFTIDGDPSRFIEITMAASFDDGFRAYLNGQEVAAENVPIESTWNSNASSGFDAIGSIPRRTLELRDVAGLLQSGPNVLAVHGMNFDSSDRDFLFDASLIASEPVSLAAQTFVTPSPNNANTLRAAPAPRIEGTQGAFFGSTTVEIVVENAPPTIVVHYTLDGSEPSQDSPRYSGPLRLEKSAMLQARAFDVSEGGQLEPSPVVAGTFVALAPELESVTSDIPLVLLDTLGAGVPNSGSTSLTPVTTLFFDTENASGRSELTGSLEYLGRGGVRRRGSTSGGQTKPNLTFELWGPDGTNLDDDFDASLAGMPADSDWILHAPFSFDLALIRNQMMFALANTVIPWAPRTQPVEVYLNTGGELVTEEDYVGTYVLMEKIKRGADRLDIANVSRTDNDPNSEAISGGYIWKADRGDPDEPQFSAGGRSINWVYPKSPGGRAREDLRATDEQQQWVIDYIDAFAATLETPDLHDPEGYSKYIDVDSWIDNHLVNVLIFNVDALRLSAYFFKDENGKLEYGPPFDCDRCMESTDSRDDNPEEWYDPGGTDFFTDDTYGDPWFQRLFKDPNFWQAYVDRWYELRQTIWSNDDLDRIIDFLAGQVAESQARNRGRWPLHPRESSAYNSGQLDGTWEGEIEHFRHWFHARAEFMDRNFVGAPRVLVDDVALAIGDGAQVSPGTSVQIAGPPITVFDATKLISSGPDGTLSRYFVPGDDSLGTSWTEIDFDDSDWQVGPSGFGFDRLDNFEGLIETEVNPDSVVRGATTLTTRTTFEIDDLSKIEDELLVLRLKYDDGFAAYLNGQRVTQRNLNSKPSEPQSWRSRGRTHTNADAVVFQEFDLTEHKHLLVEGTNLLAIRVLNSSATNVDLLLVPELESRAVRIESKTTGTTYYTTDGTDPRAANGLPSESAIEAPPGHTLPITDNTRIIARTFDVTDRGSEAEIVLTDWGAPTTHDLVIEPLSVVISEINYHPAAASASEIAAGYDRSSFEFVELYNPGPQPANLIGAKLTDGVDFDFATGDQPTLGVNEYALVVADRDAFRMRYGEELPVVGEFSGNLANGGERVHLQDGTGQTVFSVDYGDQDLWPASADGVGNSLQLRQHPIPTGGVTKHYHWRASQTPGGTPGAGTVSSLGIVINEILAHADGRDLRDAIELYNTTAGAIDVGGWYVSDSSDNFLKYQIPSPTVIGPGQYLVLDESQFNAADQQNGFALSGDAGDDVWLVIADENQQVTRIVDEVHFGASANGVSFARFPNGTGRLAPAVSRSFGTANSDPRVGPLVISELQYHPVWSAAEIAADPERNEDDLEFVEIHNPTSQPVSLTEWRIRGGIQFNFDDDLQIAPMETVVVISFNPDDAGNATRLAAFRSHYQIGDDVVVVGGYDRQLSNREDVVRLLRPDAPPDDQPNLVPRVQVDEVVYDDQSPWPTAADGRGSSLHRVTTNAIGNLASSWVAAVATPGSLQFTRLGDFDGNQQVDAADVDLLFEQLRSSNPDLAFDLNRDGAVDSRDRDHMIGDILNTTYGDANLDGTFDSEDLVALFAVQEYEDALPLNSTWAEGDFNGDGDFTSEDLVFAFRTGGYVVSGARSERVALTAASIQAAEQEQDELRKRRLRD